MKCLLSRGGVDAKINSISMDIFLNNVKLVESINKSLSFYKSNASLNELEGC